MRLRTGAALTACVLTASTLVALSPAAATQSVSAGSTDAASWLAGQLTNHRIPSTWSPGTTDWGLTADVIFALSASRVAGAATDEATAALADNVLTYISPAGGSSRTAGGVAKTLLVAVSQGQNARDFGSQDLVGDLEGMQSATAPNVGRYSDVGTGSDYSSAFSQSLAIIALARLNRLSTPSVNFLLAMQCPNGGFPYSPSFTTSACDSNDDVDNDATAIALQALSAPAVASVTGAAQARAAAAAYLASIQEPTGAFSAPPWVGANASTTGLAAASLRLAGQTAAADKAAAWISTLQVTCENAAGKPAAAHTGAIAADASALANGLAAGLEAHIDQFRRSTSQAILALPDAASYVTMSRTNATEATPTRVCQQPRVAPAAPALLAIRYDASMRAALAIFATGGNEVLSRSRAPRALRWSAWQPAANGRVAAATPRIIQVVARRDAQLSPITTVVANATRSGSSRGCQPVGPVLVRFPATNRAQLIFTPRRTSCGRINVVGKRWSLLRRGQSAVAVRTGGVVRLATGRQVITIATLSAR